MVQDIMKAICSSIQIRDRIEVITSDPIGDLDDLDNGGMEHMTKRQWRSIQTQDRLLKPFVVALREGRRQHGNSLSTEQSKLLKYFDKFVLDQGRDRTLSLL